MTPFVAGLAVGFLTMLAVYVLLLALTKGTRNDDRRLIIVSILIIIIYVYALAAFRS